MKNEKFEIDVTPNCEGVYRWLMHVKRCDIKQYNHLLDTGEGEWEKLLKMADTNGWKSHTEES